MLAHHARSRITIEKQPFERVELRLSRTQEEMAESHTAALVDDTRKEVRSSNAPRAPPTESPQQPRDGLAVGKPRLGGAQGPP